QLVARLRIHPADDLAAVIGEIAFHLPDLDACLHRGAILRCRERSPADQLRQLIVVAIALRPLRIVGEGGAALMIEKTQEVVGLLGTHRRDDDSGRLAHAVAPRRRGFSKTCTSATMPGCGGFTSPVSR